MSAGVRWWRRVLVAAGVAIAGYALVGALTDNDVNKFGVPLFLVVVLVLHDAVFLPAVLGAGAALRRFVPRRARWSVQAGALISLAVLVVGLPPVLGFGRAADNPSALPRPYGWGLLAVLAAVWAGVAITATVARHRRDGRRDAPGRRGVPGE
ncbi:hypothetical protein [Mangrovihabitans endophyticus]|uniref:Uncharacterized protein n=1 Tax=Mangrovihabitans endophyticus TaxID=1751298 RepID=A0A8J3FM59_9ACTN|nr:hypothetical protein [Mangrovihabitans endophyticus]GGK80582.1 hypothetical protein GCM10012284_13140 [Mangrovihabitans endophyticus]